MAETPGLWVVLGPTASGKSELAMALAERLGAEILSIDSMQVYRGMDIGTAKPTNEERRRVRHHLIDVVNPNEPFTVAARFVITRNDGARECPRQQTEPRLWAAIDSLPEGRGSEAEKPASHSISSRRSSSAWSPHACSA